MSDSEKDRNGILAESQLAQLHRDGFLVLKNFVSAGDTDQIRDLLDGLFDGFSGIDPQHTYDLGSGRKGHSDNRTPSIRDTVTLVPKLAQTEIFERACAVSRQLFRRPVERLWDAAVFKSPHSNSETPWHQDEGVYQFESSTKPVASAFFWLALQPTTKVNGCMSYIPASHLGGVLPHHRRHQKSGAVALEAEGVDLSQAVVCPLDAGDVSIHLPRTLHHTGPNTTDDVRKAWVLQIGCPRWPRMLRRIKRAAQHAVGRG